MPKRFPGHIGILHGVVAKYRAPVFDQIAERCDKGASVCAGRPLAEENIVSAEKLERATWVEARNRQLLGGPAILYWQSGVLKWLREYQPDVVIMETNPRYLSSFLVRSWMHHCKRPVIGWGLGIMPLSKGMLIARGFGRRRFLRSMDALVSYSSLGAQQYRELGFPAERVFTAFNAVTHRPQDPAPIRSERQNQPPVVLFVGRVTEAKRLDLLLRACARLPRELQPQLQIVGEGPVRQELQEIASTVYPQAKFFGAVHGEELKQIFRAADLFVLPGIGGLAIQEAMTYGLPVVVAEADGTQADLVRPANGWNLVPGDLDALVTTLREALSDRQRLRQMGLESYRIVAEEVNIEAMVDVFIAAARRVIGLDQAEK
ncbi:MAG TPA: glycosyltransferase family 4 protein [Tepidisphaeraceae bacterium]